MMRRVFEPISVEPSLPTPLLPTPAFRAAFVAALVGALVISSIQAIGAMTLASRAAFFATDLGMIGFALAFRSRDRRAVAVYLLIQTIAGSFLAIISRSDAELALLAIVAQTVLCAPRWVAITLGGWAFVASTLGSLRHGVGLHYAAALSTTSLVGSIFVIAFVELAIRAFEAKAEAARLVADLASANEQLRTLSVHVQELAAERERTRIARDLHDIAGHALTAAHAQLSGALAVNSRDSHRAQRMVETARDLIGDGLTDLRSSVTALRGGLARPLLEELRRLFATLGEGGLEHSVVVLGDEAALRDPPPSVALAVHRGVQECLTNSLRHAHATKVELSIENIGETLFVTFEDDGVGATLLIPGTGLNGLESRVLEVGGTLRFGRGRLGGVRVELSVPMTPSVSHRLRG